MTSKITSSSNLAHPHSNRTESGSEESDYGESSMSEDISGCEQSDSSSSMPDHSTSTISSIDKALQDDLVKYGGGRPRTLSQLSTGTNASSLTSVSPLNSPVVNGCHIQEISISSGSVTSPDDTGSEPLLRGTESIKKISWAGPSKIKRGIPGLNFESVVSRRPRAIVGAARDRNASIDTDTTSVRSMIEHRLTNEKAMVERLLDDLHLSVTGEQRPQESFLRQRSRSLVALHHPRLLPNPAPNRYQKSQAKQKPMSRGNSAAALTIKQRERHNMSFSNDRFHQIQRENQRLLKAIVAKKEAPTKQAISRSRTSMPQIMTSSSGRSSSCSYNVERFTSAAINRRREGERIEQQNFALSKRLMDARPTREYTRNHLGREYVKNNPNMLPRSFSLSKLSRQFN